VDPQEDDVEVTEPKGNPLAQEYGLSPEQTKFFDAYL
jgi:hypothetical protein